MFNYEQELPRIYDEVIRVLGSQKDYIVVLKTKEELHNYITQVISAGVVAVDTETNNSTIPLSCKLVGACLYAPGLKQAYVPINHIDYKTGLRLLEQCSEQDLKVEFQRLIDNNITVVMHNAKFDYSVIKCTCNIDLEAKWDTMVAAHLLNENEKSFGLKQLYIEKINPLQEKYSLEKLFGNVPYEIVDPNIFAYYAATDSKMTYELYKYQLDLMSERSNKRVKWLFEEIEMPVIRVTAEMELRGLTVDLDFVERLDSKFKKQLNEVDSEIADLLISLKPLIDNWYNSQESYEPSIQFEPETNKSHDPKYDEYDSTSGNFFKYGKPKRDKLSDPIKLSSPDQLSILIYDILKLPQCAIRKPRSTGSSILQLIQSNIKPLISDYLHGTGDIEEEVELDDEMLDNFMNTEDIDWTSYEVSNYIAGYTLINLIITRQKLVKLIGTYLKPLPTLTSLWSDGLVRPSFKTLGAVTGRFSSGGKLYHCLNGERISVSNLNFQGIPEKTHQIRMLFKARPGYTFIGADLGQQEPRVMAYLSRDQKLIEAFKEKKDIYAIVAQSYEGNSYEDNLEFHSDGTIYKDGKKRRKKAKTVLLASMYGMSGATLASRLGVNKAEGIEKLDAFFSYFSGVKQVIEQSVDMCKDFGYIEDIKGRRRRLDDIQLPLFELYYKTNPSVNQDNPDAMIATLLNRLRDPKLTYDGIKKILSEASSQGLIARTHKQRIMRAERQCFNARIQGSSATMTKKLMLELDKDPELLSYGAHLLLQVHDEVLLECPLEYAEKASARLKFMMENACRYVGIDIPMACDATIEERWGEDSMSVDILERYDDLKNDSSVDDPLSVLAEEFEEFPKNSLEKLVKNETSVIKF